MSDVIPLRGDPHEQAQRLLPWYANGTLDADEAATVEAHLADCAECQADLRMERALGREDEATPLDVDRGWAALREQMARAPVIRPAVSVAPPMRRSFFRRPVAIGWALGAQAAALLLFVGVGRFDAGPAQAPVYKALGTPRAAAAGNIVVVFRPDTLERDLRQTLVTSGARLVDGPTASDAYVLHVADASRATALLALRANTHVMVAEPIDGDVQP
jgi:anti-sigma factor RsiW